MKILSMDSSFFLLRGFLGMFGIGVHRSELVKKPIYFSTVIYVYGINYYCKKRNR